MRLCFGSLFTVMAGFPSLFATNPSLCAAMFSTVAVGFDSIDPTNVSGYAVGKTNIPDTVAKEASKADPQKVAISFRDGVIKYLDRNRRKDVVLALQEIVIRDPKAVGLAKFADLHWDKFGRIQLIRRKTGPDGKYHFYRLDMANAQIRDRVRAIHSNIELDHIFDECATLS